MLLLTGSNGQVGKALRALLPAALAPSSRELDIGDPSAVQRYAEENKVTHIINCAAYTAVDAAEDHFEDALRVNGRGAENLARTGARLLHLSTDYVFDGHSCRPYLEEDAPSPLSVYGRTKLAGERAVLELASNALIVRTAWVCSPYGHNFLRTIRKLAAERETLNVVNDQIGAPTFAEDLAAALVRLLPLLDEQGGKDIYHFTNEGVCSWYDFAYEIVRRSGLPCKVLPLASKDYPARAPRPPFSVLSKEKIRKKLGLDIPHWTEGLQRCLKQFS